MSQTQLFNQALLSAREVVRAGAEARISYGDEIADAMRYAMVGGKALRGFLVLEGARMHGVSVDAAAPAAVAIEALHAYSLVHDDLPCMDDDDLRRGMPTVHRKWDEATAVLTGDALQAFAFENLMYVQASETAKLRLVHHLALEGRGMVIGQAMDIAAETSTEPLTLEGIERLQDLKTGALIKWSCDAGAVLADADPQALGEYGSALGRAFQIADDVLDVEGDPATVGKAVGKDAGAGKATFVSLLGLDEAKRRARQLVEAACDALSCYGDDAETLKEAARFVITRSH